MKNVFTIFTTFFGKNKQAPQKTPNSESLKDLFKDNSYLSYSQKPEGIVVVPMRNFINDAQHPDRLLEENAKALKELGRDYNVKIIALTDYNSPSKENRSRDHRLMISSGISEVYYGERMYEITQTEMLQGKKSNKLQHKLIAAQAIKDKFGVAASNVFMVNHDFMSNDIFAEEGYTLVSSVNDLTEVVSQSVAKRKFD